MINCDEVLIITSSKAHKRRQKLDPHTKFYMVLFTLNYLSKRFLKSDEK